MINAYVLAFGGLLLLGGRLADLIGRRRMFKQLESQLAAAPTRLSSDILERIDEIVAPGVDINPEDGPWPTPALNDTRLRRRSPSAATH